jgi:PPM family protein phosphatase
VIPVLIVVVLAGAAIGTYFWTQSQYFVGRKGASVAVFRGVNTAFGPVHMYRVVERSDLRYGDLNPAARDQVDSGITATNRRDAEQIIDRLRGRLLPLCITEPSQTPSPSPSTSVRVTPSNRATTPRRTTVTPTPTPTSTPPSPTPTPTPQQPGVDCRPAR